MTLLNTRTQDAKVYNMLSIVATPIGNLEDITLRAINVLSNADLMERYNIKKEILSYHQHSGLQKIDKVIEMLKKGKNLVLVTDAGTPGISDPGSFLVSEALKEIPDLKVVPIPGPNAAIAALSISGFPTDEFVFLGFPPHKKGRQTFFKNISKIESTVVFYESKHRILKALENLEKLSELGDRKIIIARELTKQFETIYRGTLAEIKPKLTDKNLLGEFVVVVGPKPRK